MNRVRMLAAAAAVPTLLSAVLGGAPAAASAPAHAPVPAPASAPVAEPLVPHCVTPDGIDLNELYGVKHRIIGPPTCRTTREGEKWVRTVAPWFTAADAASAVYPEGYRPSRRNPIDDFNSKFVSATYVHDRGTPNEQTFTFPRKKVLRTGFVSPEGLPYSVAVSPPLAPLSVGTHTSTVFVTLSKEHCDGLGTVRAENCLPAGTFQWTDDNAFEVVARPGRPGEPGKPGKPAKPAKPAAGKPAKPAKPAKPTQGKPAEPAAQGR
ncbi:hypothetical protein [Streptomyces bambusae]|uniref:hypothetical protein n=1 Tax=Streptomyces bambusae TaxID=1550616 RepID=UPI001CA5DDCD|nr:hypothetical protein [Streptomyces bambusae]